MRRNARVDANHKAVVDALRSVGASVQSLAPVGRGCPDLIVGFRRRNFLMEVKDGDKPPSACKLTPDEEQWHLNWRGEVLTVYSPNEAIEAIV